MTDMNATPDLQYVGKADEVVLGMLGVGGDVFGEYLVTSMEFAGDEPGSNA